LNPPKSTQSAGQEAEDQAFEELQRRGLKLVARNWRCRGGELDLVMLDGDTVVFVEVRFRSHAAWGGALESVDARKRGRLGAAAEQFLQAHPRWREHGCRFDVVAMSPGKGAAAFNWIQNAFDT
jgi:putative endonuclease